MTHKAASTEGNEAIGRTDLAARERDRFGRLLDRTSQPFLTTDLEGEILHANRAFAELLGFAPEALIGRTIAEITPPQWQDISRKALERLIASGIAQRYHKEYQHRLGHFVPVACVTDIDFDEDDRPRGYYAFVTDMTESKRAEEALRASEERFRELYDEAPFGYHVIDTHGLILSVNRTECELLGYSRDEMLGVPIFDFIDAAEREDARNAVAHCVAGDSTMPAVERTYRTKDGRALALHIENRLLRDRSGRVIGIRSTVQDMSASRATQAALVASERRLRALFEGIDDAVFVHDFEGRILDANPAASRKLGYTHEEFLRLNTKEIDDSSFSAGFEGRLEEQLRLGHLSCEGRHRTKDGRAIPVDINTSIIQYNQQVAVLAVMRDLTERHRMRDLLLQSEKLASIGLLSAGVAHEINNPLSFIANNLAVLERDLTGVLEMVDAYESASDVLQMHAPAAHERVSQIAEVLDWAYVRGNLARMMQRTRDGVQRVATIVGHLRGLARTAPPRLEPALLSDIIDTALDMVQARMKRSNIALEIERAELPKIPCVPTQINQVLINLFMNAIQAMEERPKPPHVLRVRLDQAEGYQRIVVQDTGPGIAPENIERIFDPFYSSKPVGEGTGLGLAISHGIVAGHGGRIEVRSAIGEGTTFLIWLPETPKKSTPS